MSEPTLNQAMRRNPEWHVKAHNPRGGGAQGTTARAYLAQYDEAIRQARAEAWAEGHAQGVEDSSQQRCREPLDQSNAAANPYRNEK